MTVATFRKRCYTLGALLADLVDVVRCAPGFISARPQRRVSRAFAEKVMLVVTQVNGCRYCSYAHTVMALRSGVSSEELGKLLALEIDSFPPEQAVALAFAQHYAESGGRPGLDVEIRFRTHYGPEVIHDVVNYIRIITLGNLAGNTVDSFLSRLRGCPAEGSNPLTEFLIFIFPAPFLLPPLLLMRRSDAVQS